MKTKLLYLCLTLAILLACTLTPVTDAVVVSQSGYKRATLAQAEPTPWVLEADGRKAGGVP